MEPNETERRRESRRQGDQGFAPQQQDTDSFVPSFLTARELQAWNPAKDGERRGAPDRRAPRSDLNVRRIIRDEE